MNYDELKRIAERKGAIRWLTSRKIEFLSMEGENVVAHRLVPRQTHIIHRWPHYLCVEIPSSERVILLDLDWSVWSITTKNPLPAMGIRVRR